MQQEQKGYHQESIDTLIKSYLDKIEQDVIEQRIARMVARHQDNATLICDDSLRNDFDRDKLVTTPLCQLSPCKNEALCLHKASGNNHYCYKDEPHNIIDLIRLRLPDNGYHVYYHYNYEKMNICDNKCIVNQQYISILEKL